MLPLLGLLWGEHHEGVTTCGTSSSAPFSPQAPCIPDELCGRVYDFCKKLLTLPKPFCTIGLDYAARLKMERTAPGTRAFPCVAPHAWLLEAVILGA